MPPIDFEASRGTMNPMSAPKPGFYKARVEGAEMRQSGKTGEMYLNLKLALRNDKDEKCGTVFDGLFDPKDKAPLKFKMGQFLKAVGLTTLKRGELTDLLKLVPNRELVVDIKNAPDNKGRIRGEVEPFARGGYYPLTDWADCFARDGGVAVSPQPDEEPPFDLGLDEAPKAAPTPTPAPTAIPDDDF